MSEQFRHVSVKETKQKQNKNKNKKQTNKQTKKLHQATYS